MLENQRLALYFNKISSTVLPIVAILHFALQRTPVYYILEQVIIPVGAGEQGTSEVAIGSVEEGYAICTCRYSSRYERGNSGEECPYRAQICKTTAGAESDECRSRIRAREVWLTNWDLSDRFGHICLHERFPHWRERRC